MCGLLENLWDCKQVVLRQNGFHGPAFQATRGTMHGGLVSPTQFNVVLDNFIRKCLAMKVEDKKLAHDGLGETVGQCLGVFYVNNGMVSSSVPD